MRKNTGCVSIILIMFLLACVRWLRFLVVPAFVVFIALAVLGVVIGARDKRKTGRDGSEGRKAGKQQPGKSQQARKPEEMGSGRKASSSVGSGRKAAGHKVPDTMIICEYCGSQVDTAKHSTCPHCGGSYWDNVQWKEIWKRKMSQGSR